jgi:AcrR family transcriptional regulator
LGNTKERIMGVTAEFFRRQGYSGTGVKQILAAANAPFGSLYHHFPGGKEQLGAEVIRQSGALYQQLFETIFDVSAGPVEAMRNFFVGAGETLRQSDYADACPIATIALEVASTSEPMRQASVEVFEGWIGSAVSRLTAAGLAAAESRALALFMIMQLEGAFLLCRTFRSTEAMEVAGAAVVKAVEEAMAQPRRLKKPSAGRASARSGAPVVRPRGRSR